jgi:tetrahydromethanopterin S-methyltransferase subunit A
MKRQLKEDLAIIKNEGSFVKDISDSDKIYQELETVRAKNNGVLEAADVVNFARKKDSALHRYFEWNDSYAAELYRIEQARKIIRVCVCVDEVTQERTRVYVSLPKGGSEREGYRTIVDVMNDEDLTQQLIDAALKDLQFFSNKYRSISNIAKVKPVFDEIEVLLGKLHPSRKQERERA